MTTAIFLDNNIWDFLLKRGMDLATELPAKDFSLFITREAEFEIAPIPPEKGELKAFIENAFRRCSIKTHSYLGFDDPRHADGDQRVSGCDVGFFASPDEIDFIRQQTNRVGIIKKPSTRLFRNEADVSLAARSFHSIVLTLDSKPGPLKDAFEQGGRVVFLTAFDASGMKLRDYIESSAPPSTSDFEPSRFNDTR
jgi:hypothetical protein